MQDEMKNFMGDLVWEIQEKYNQSLLVAEGENLEEKNFRLGSNISYYDVLELIRSQLEAFGFNIEEVGAIVPMLGEKIDH